MSPVLRSGADCRPIECIVDSRCNLGEAPVWSQQHLALFWLDIAAASLLFEWNPSSGRTRTWPLGELATGLAPTPDGLMILSESGLRTFHIASGTLQPLAPAPFSMDGIRFNDCGCDRMGRLWTGTMRNDFQSAAAIANTAPNNEAVGRICRFDPDLSCHSMASGIGCPNTFVWSLDDQTLYTADSATGCLYAFDFDLRAGAIANQRIFAAPTNLGVPDGSALDAQGCLWNARWGAGCVARFAPDGRVLECVSLPTDLVTSCAFGGRELDTLFVTTARSGLSEPRLAQQSLAGGVFAFRPDVPGIAPPRFRGAPASTSCTPAPSHE